MKSGMLAFGALIWAAPVFAQAPPDPLAPLPVPSPQQTQTSPAPAPTPVWPAHETVVPILGPPAPTQTAPAAAPPIASPPVVTVAVP